VSNATLIPAGVGPWFHPDIPVGIEPRPGGPLTPRDVGLPYSDPELRLIGLSGYAGSGKDTVAKMLGPRGYQRVAFADPLRTLAYHMNPAIQDRVDVEGWDQAKKVDYIRPYLQKLGVLARHHLGNDVWIRPAVEKLWLHGSLSGRWVITDVRFHNEASAIRDLGGRLVRLLRPDVGPVNDHISETEMGSLSFGYDYILNNDSTPAVLFDRVQEMEEALF